MKSPIPGVPVGIAYAMIAFVACVVLFRGWAILKAIVGFVQNLVTPRPRPSARQRRMASVASILD